MAKGKKSKKSKKNRGFKYQERSKAQWKERQNEGSGSFDSYIKDGTTLFKPRDGSNKIRILPPTWEDADDFALKVTVHYGIGADDQSYLCLKMNGEDCPICDESVKLQKAGDSEEAKELKPNKRYGVWLIDRKSEADGPQFWAMPFGVHRDLLIASEDDDGEILQLDHPEEGYDVLFKKEGSGLKTKYVGVKLSRKSLPISSDEDDMAEILSFVQDNPITSLLKFYPEEYISGVFSGGLADSNEDEEDEEEEEEEDEEDEDEDEDEDGKDEDDDEDNDDDEDDEDEEEKDDDDDEDEEEDDDDIPFDDDDEDEDDSDRRKAKKKSKSGSASSKLKAAAERVEGKKSGKKKKKKKK